MLLIFSRYNFIFTQNNWKIVSFVQICLRSEWPHHYHHYQLNYLDWNINKNNIWKGNEYADIRYKKIETILVEGTMVWWWQMPDCLLRFFSLYHLWQIESLSIVLFLDSPCLSATYVSLNGILGFYVFFFPLYDVVGFQSM